MPKVLSVEDGSLSSSIRNSRTTTTYNDFDLTFAKVSDTGDVYRKRDAAAVKQAVKNMILTNRFEKPFRPNYGANIAGLLFELETTTSKEKIRRQIVNTVQRYEPRAEVQRIDVYTQNNVLRCSITFKVKGVETIETIETTLSKLR